MKVGVVQLPGSTGDRDLLHALIGELHVRARLFPHKSKSFAGADAIIIPGGCSFGDHLRAGALAKSTPILQAIKDFATSGGPILGIGNGFQVLCEAKLLPGTFTENASRMHYCDYESLNVEDSTKNFSIRRLGETIELPVSHRFGRYWVDDRDLNSLQTNQQILFRYANNPNGSVGNIAAIRNRDENVFGMMPHPEAAVEHGIHRSTIGARVLSAFLKQPKVEPKVPQLNPDAQAQIEQLLINCASSMSMDKIYAYLPGHKMLLSVNGERTVNTTDSSNDVGEYLHKLHKHSAKEQTSNMATTTGNHYVITETSQHLSLMSVAYRNKVVLARIIKEVGGLNEKLADILDKSGN
ncbi:phosphoribosylformylglycinamidine synthase subunit PurQ [Cerasicoccus fimbriatus]|uniref:phosphoribosylformylglycinamidine synthase subunit PurQ n=1 Tax=Cerasicoccus fimbriatus TaxID=3014554 RepID=UPI0022B596BB|nr:phosphoribosylformylglycinamidine synthase subunit PurQ [Cerasicoccus sp. TK19100]